MARKVRRLSTRRLSYLFVFILGFMWVFFFGGVVPYAIFFLCALLPGLSVVHLFWVRRHVGLGQALSADRVRKQEQVSHFVCVTNRSRLLFVPALRVDFGQGGGEQAPVTRAVDTLMPRENSEAAASMSFPYRGRYTVAPPEVRLGDMLGLCLVRKKLPGTLALTVCPHVHQLSSCRLLFGMSPALHRQTRSSRNEVSVACDTRKYQYGDPVNRIHWKLTAQKGELISRLFESEEESEVLLLLDTAPPPPGATCSLEVADRLTEAVLAVLFFCLRNHYAARLVHYAGQPQVTGQRREEGGLFIARQRDRVSFDTLFSHLSIVPFDSEAPFDELVRHAMNPSDAYAGTVVFTARLTESLLTAVAELHAPGRPAAVVYAAPAAAPPVLPVAPPFTICTVAPGEDLRAALEVEAVS